MYSKTLRKKVDFNLQSTKAIYEFHEPSFVNKLQKEEKIHQTLKELVCAM